MSSARWFPRLFPRRAGRDAPPSSLPRRAVACPHCGTVLRLPVFEERPGKVPGRGVLVVECSQCGSAYRC